MRRPAISVHTARELGIAALAVQLLKEGEQDRLYLTSGGAGGAAALALRPQRPPLRG